MKKLCVLLLLLLYFSAYGTGMGNGNPFLQRKIIIGSFSNKGADSYDYLRESLRDTLYSSFVSVPFITLNDEERSFLQVLAEDEAYREHFALAGSTIGYRLEPVVQKGEGVGEGHPLFIRGDYEMGFTEATGELLTLTIEVYNALTGDYQLFSVEGTLVEYFEKPRMFFTPFFDLFLRYETYRASFTTEPPDALIFLDGKLVGTGSATSLLVIPGSHRIRVRRTGYEEFSDLFQITTDPFSRHLVLQREQDRITYRITTNVKDVQVYIDEQYIGTAPVRLAVGLDDRTLTLIKEGYRTESITLGDLPLEGGEVFIGLIYTGMQEELFQKAERHKKRAKILSWGGFGTLGGAILFGVLSTLNRQEADLLASSDPQGSDDADQRATLYSYLTVSSLLVAGGFFTFSFIDTLKYFNLYNRTPLGEIPIVTKEVPF
jgi:hypothetical protein